MSNNVLWPLEPHTQAKHTLLRNYLNAWFPILGKYHRRLNIIVGFAGPGEYAGGEVGSPIIALDSAREHLKNGTLPQNIEINFIFIEGKAEHASHLQNRLVARTWPKNFIIRVIEGQFRDRIGTILDQIEAKKTSLAPTFAFVDPFGFSGIPMSLLARILKYPKCEVLVNVMVDFINRFLAHPNDDITRHLPETFGTKDVLDIPTQAGNRFDSIFNLYRRQLLQQAKFVVRFDMFGRQDRLRYSLFFASNDEKGLEKIKDAMWRVDKLTGSKFSSTDQTPRLFEAWDYTPLWNEIKTRFGLQTVPMSDIEHFVITKTDFLPKHARELFKEHEGDGDIEVIPIGAHKRRKGTYPADKVRIRFVK